MPLIANFGFSLGINDVIPGPKLTLEKESKVAKAYADCLNMIAQAKKGKLENKAGCNQEETLEAMISSSLSKVRDEVGEICMKELSRYNAPLIMATCGSKGLSFTFSPLLDTDIADRLHYQRFSNGRVCRPASHIWSPCPRRIPRPLPPSFPKKVERASVERFRQ